MVRDTEHYVFTPQVNEKFVDYGSPELSAPYKIPLTFTIKGRKYTLTHDELTRFLLLESEREKNKTYKPVLLKERFVYCLCERVQSEIGDENFIRLLEEFRRDDVENSTRPVIKGTKYEDNLFLLGVDYHRRGDFDSEKSPGDVSLEIVSVAVNRYMGSVLQFAAQVPMCLNMVVAGSDYIYPPKAESLERVYERYSTMIRLSLQAALGHRLLEENERFNEFLRNHLFNEFLRNYAAIKNNRP